MDGKLVALPTNIRKGWKWMKVHNTLAYYNTAQITAVISFITQALVAGTGNEKIAKK